MPYQVQVLSLDGEVSKRETYSTKEKAVKRANEHLIHDRHVRIQERIGSKHYHHWETIYDWQYKRSPVAVVITPRYNLRNFWRRELFNNEDDARAAKVIIQTYLDEHPYLMAAVTIL